MSGIYDELAELELEDLTGPLTKLETLTLEILKAKIIAGNTVTGMMCEKDNYSETLDECMAWAVWVIHECKALETARKEWE